MRVLGLIPARGGSKRLPGKNMRMFHGTPLIQKTIDEAKKSIFINSLYVSSDDPEILSFASQHCGVIKRPEKLATDDASMADVVTHAIGLHPRCDYVVVLQPTSPLRTVEDIHCGSDLGMSISVGPTGAPNGAVYVIQTAFWKFHRYFGGRVFYMPAERSIDINTLEDFQEAERLYK